MIISVGDIMLDIYIDEPLELNRDTDTRGGTSLRWGGSAANFAVWAARLGSGSAMVGRVGGDFVGRAAIDDLRFEGVEALVRIGEDAETGTVVVRRRGGTGREMICDRKANAAFCEEDLPLDVIRRADWVHISGYTAIEEGPRKAVVSCIRAAREGSAVISVDPGSCSLIGDMGVDRFLDAVDGAHLVLPNFEEAKLITGGTDPMFMAEMLLEKFPMAVIKLGAEGALFAERGGRRGTVPAFDAEAVDVNGAGDAFGAGFAACYTAHRDIALATEAGCALAALVVGAKGARPRIAVREKMARFFSAREGNRT